MSRLVVQNPPAMAPRTEAIEASVDDVRIRVDEMRLRLGITGGRPVEGYGRTSALSEDLLLRGYGVRRPRVEDET